MSSQKMRTNLKLSRLLYKYTEEKKEEKPIEDSPKLVEEEYESYPPYNFSWFIENKVAAMGWPQTVANLNYLADAGVDHLITLSPERRPPILDCKKKLKWTEIRIKEFGTPTLRQIIKFIEICERAEIRGEVIGVHCRHGRGRTGTMLACYLGWHATSCISATWRPSAVLTVRVQRPGSCETYEQEKIVCHYHDCVRGTIAKPDYRLVEDKLYFDCSMKHMFEDTDQEEDEQTTKKDKNAKKETVVKFEEDFVDRKELIKKLCEKKTNTMIINHRIYF
ncbi:dual specificity protein phosphatase 23-like [Leguminivora glycinivorella]|uniref:dual specificity protein phosphatase 23-like n=1 Tax=Leguminivora glycinivorella TaxID=1035111 RepID=UPI00200C7EF5|nr:dual specificity protein phosphatase 23-like [Leguminivora glycinivorella]XP_048001211.1 dual specificity protein phosphatase 23-like [Leguminivora glycinivorella]